MAAQPDPLRDLLELATVHGFYVHLLEQTTGHPVPTPRQAAAGDRVEQSLAVLRNWIDILDMAISPVALRDSLKQQSGDTIEALLRYYVLKNSRRDTDRDKTDFVASYLFRHPAEWRRRSITTFTESSDAAALYAAKAYDFEAELTAVLSAPDLPALPQEHQQLLREFEFVYQEVEDLRHFDALMDSGIVQRVREMKAAFGASFYHPRVLAHVAVYNTLFGQHFDKLFAQAGRADQDLRRQSARGRRQHPQPGRGRCHGQASGRGRGAEDPQGRIRHRPGRFPQGLQVQESGGQAAERTSRAGACGRSGGGGRRSSSPGSAS
ncbi:MAG TPA: hypothetical protein VMS96_11610 [Terriglobales bacterium]|nr:hypothetical protein [Terriglobales bacterium]